MKPDEAIKSALVSLHAALAAVHAGAKTAGPFAAFAMGGAASMIVKAIRELGGLDQ